uniref:Uncharacterized protein n=1 Tax=Timema poppense TaxID=170557 RepID=A0A7R9HC79_TIMPO|nr:unnamed protein product [Timema poppensis]
MLAVWFFPQSGWVACLGWNFHLKRWWAYFKLYYLSQSDHCVSEDQDQLLPSKEEERMEAPKKLNREEWVEDLDVDIEHLSTNFHNIDVSCQKVRGRYPPQQKYTKIGWYRPSTCEDVGLKSLEDHILSKDKELMANVVVSKVGRVSFPQQDFDSFKELYNKIKSSISDKGDLENVDIMMVHGCDHAGNSIHIRITRRRHRVTDVWLHVQLQDGTHYQLPACCSGPSQAMLWRQCNRHAPPEESGDINQFRWNLKDVIPSPVTANVDTAPSELVDTVNVSARHKARCVALRLADTTEHTSRAHHQDDDVDSPEDEYYLEDCNQDESAESDNLDDGSQ